MKRQNRNLNLGIFLFLFTVLFSFGCKDDKGEDPQPNPGGGENAISLNLQFLDLTHNAAEEEITLDASADWAVTNPADTWITVSPASGRQGKSISIALNVKANETTATRTAKLVFKTTQGNAADTLTVRQAGNTPYVAIDWEEEATLSRFDLNSGTVEINFKNGVPAFQNGASAIVVPTDSLSYIRVINNAKVSGNSVTLQTEAGDMTDIFMDQEFTLSTVPADRMTRTRSGLLNTTDKDGVIHPTQISMQMEDGRKEVIYDANTDMDTRSVPDNIVHKINFFHWGEDFSGQKLYDQKGVTLQWDKCVYEAAIDGKFYFNFGSTTEVNSLGLQVPKGDLYGFFYLLEGSLNFDFLLHLIAQYEHTYETKEPVVLIDHVFKPKLVIKFAIGTVPVFITVDPSIKSEMYAKAEARGDVSGGFNAGASLKVGAEYTVDNGLKPLPFTFDSHFDLYNPEIKVRGKVEGNITIYPDINVRLYNFAGFDIQFKPYIGDEMNYGGVAGGYDENYMAWTNRLYQQLDIYGNLSLDFIGNEWRTEPIRLGGTEQKDLVRSPDEIEITLQDDTYAELNQPILVPVQVKDYCFVGDPTSSVHAVVKFEAINGTVDKEFAITNALGRAQVFYTPNSPQSTLIAKIIDADNNTIDSDVFRPSVERIESIIGIWNNPNAEASKVQKHQVVFYEDGTFHYVFKQDPSIEDPYLNNYGYTYWVYDLESSGTYSTGIRELGEGLSIDCVTLNVNNIINRSHTVNDGVASDPVTDFSIVAPEFQYVFGQSGSYGYGIFDDELTFHHLEGPEWPLQLFLYDRISSSPQK